MYALNEVIRLLVRGTEFGPSSLEGMVAESPMLMQKMYHLFETQLDPLPAVNYNKNIAKEFGNEN